jgi:predicted HTH transcriptional regulator
MAALLTVVTQEQGVTMNEARIRELIAAGESATLELKTSVPTPDVIAVQLASMGNTIGGTLLMGVKEPSTIIGVNPKKAESYVDAALQKMMHIHVTDRGSILVDGKTLYYVTVAKSDRLVVPGAGYYKRVGTQPQPLTAEEIHALSIPKPALEQQIEKLSELAQAQLKKIDDLGEVIAKANSWKKKAPAAILGAVLGAIAKELFAMF